MDRFFSSPGSLFQQLWLPLGGLFERLSLMQSSSIQHSGRHASHNIRLRTSVLSRLGSNPNRVHGAGWSRKQNSTSSSTWTMHPGECWASSRCDPSVCRNETVTEELSTWTQWPACIFWQAYGVIYILLCTWWDLQTYLHLATQSPFRQYRSVARLSKLSQSLSTAEQNRHG